MGATYFIQEEVWNPSLSDIVMNDVFCKTGNWTWLVSQEGSLLPHYHFAASKKNELLTRNRIRRQVLSNDWVSKKNWIISMESDKQLNCLQKGRQTKEASLLAILAFESCPIGPRMSVLCYRPISKRSWSNCSGSIEIALLGIKVPGLDRTLV